MPMITLQIAAEPDDRLARDAARLVTGRVAEILGKDPKVTAVAVEFIPRKHWYIGGRSTEEIGKAAFFLDVRISDGTNTKDEKARFVAAMFAALDALLGGVDPESYVHVDDVRADAYGYGGLTQERRYVQSRPVAA
ncbi:MAG TPA: 4-oxalocrotonate tautomerase family protein [Myxococcales bacterium]|nr:4-oxalocrotonate tautomerase family protein [Myxococcales bacterium]